MRRVPYVDWRVPKRAMRRSKLLQAIPGATENGLCAALIERLDLLSEMLNAIASSTQDSYTALSSMLRCAQIENYMGLCALQRSMTGA